MSQSDVDFDAPDLARQVEQLDPAQVDTLPFGAIRIDREGTILFYSASERQQSGYTAETVGRNLYTLTECLNRDDFRGRIMRAMEQNNVDVEIGWKGDYRDSKRDLRLRVQSTGANDGVWIFIQRDPQQNA